MTLNVLTYPDKKLKEISKEVVEFNEELHRFLDNMYETMLEYRGIGLAAIQVGQAKRVLIINIPRDDDEQYREDLLEIINPEIIEKDGTVVYQEGCLSVPEFYEEVERSEEIKLKYVDRNNQEKILEAKGLLSIAIQHEIDHLNGKLFVEKLPMLKRKKFEKEWKKTHRK